MSPRRLYHRVGNRGIVLTVLGFLWIITATSLATAPTIRIGVPDEYLPLWLRVSIWGISGTVAMVAAWWKRWDEQAWGLLILPLGLRLLSFIYGAIAGTFHPFGRAMISICVFGAMALLVNRCAAGLDRPAPWNGQERRWTQRQ